MKLRPDALFLAGWVLLAYGAWQIARPAGILVGGLGLIVTAVIDGLAQRE